MKTNDNNQACASPQTALASSPLPFCRKAIAQLEIAKSAIFSEFEEGLEEHANVLRLAVNEAEALAWQTDYPHLLFPTLASEKAQTTARWHARQRALRPGHNELTFAA